MQYTIKYNLHWYIIFFILFLFGVAIVQICTLLFIYQLIIFSIVSRNYLPYSGF